MLADYDGTALLLPIALQILPTLLTHMTPTATGDGSDLHTCRTDSQSHQGSLRPAGFELDAR
jgi:hypothetical protein